MVRPGLAGVVVPKAKGAHDVATIAALIDPLEAAAGLAPGSVRIMVVATETPAAMFALGSYAPPHPRLIGLTWGAEDLAAAIGATANKEPDGAWTEPYRIARSLCLFAAAAAEVAPINRCFSPSDEDVAEARRIVAAFSVRPDLGTIDIDGKMYDIPHLKAAQKTLAAAGEQT